MRYPRDAAALLLILLLCAGADGLMDKLGPVWFPLVGGAVLAAAWALTKAEPITNADDVWDGEPPHG